MRFYILQNLYPWKYKVNVTLVNLHKFQKKTKWIFKAIVLLKKQTKKQNKILKNVITVQCLFIRTCFQMSIPCQPKLLNQQFFFLASFLYSLRLFCLDLCNLHASCQRCMASIGLKSWRSGPSIHILSKLLRCSCFSEFRESVFILFMNEEKCSTLSFDTGNANKSSATYRSKFHSLPLLDSKILYHTIWYELTFGER